MFCLQILPSHYLNGQLILRCTAEVGTYYADFTEAPLETTRKEPIPERGEHQHSITSPTGAARAIKNDCISAVNKQTRRVFDFNYKNLTLLSSERTFNCLVTTKEAFLLLYNFIFHSTIISSASLFHLPLQSRAKHFSFCSLEK